MTSIVHLSAIRSRIWRVGQAALITFHRSVSTRYLYHSRVPTFQIGSILVRSVYRCEEGI